MLTTRVTLLNNRGATGLDATLAGDGLKNLYFQVNGTNTSAMTILIRGSYEEVAPDFAAASSPTNIYDNMAVVDLEDGAVIDGDTGIVLAANDNRNFTLNAENPPTHLAAVITSHTTGNVTVKAVATNNTVGN